MFTIPDPSTDANVDKEAVKRFTTISPDLSDIGAQSPSNEHIDRLATILLTYNFYEKELGQNLFRFGSSSNWRNRLCPGHVGSLRAPLRRYGGRRRDDILVFRGVHGSNGNHPLSPIHSTDKNAETELFTGSERNEETAIFIATTDQHYGPRIVQALWLASFL